MTISSNIWRIFKQVVVGSAIASKAVASTFPAGAMPEPDSTWQNVRREIEAQNQVVPLPEALQYLISEHYDEPDELVQTVRLSYLAVSRRDTDALDAFWLAHPRIKNDPQLFNSVLTLRSLGLDGATAPTPDDLLEKWILRAHHKPGHYQGGGNSI